MASDHKNGSVGSYIFVALVLGVITYVEFAIVEYPQAWLGSTWTLVLLAVLSVIKFVMVVLFFMHLKGDDRIYSGFFTSGMVFALATFIAMTAMFILPRAMSNPNTAARDAQEAGQAAGHAEAALDPEVAELIETDGRSRTAAARADSPAPTDRSTSVTAPQAANDASTFAVDAPAPAEAEPDVAEAADETAAAPAETAVDETTADAADAAEDGADAAAEAAAPPAAAADWDRAQGAQVYNTTCVGCHQGAGQGIPGAFPPLANHAAALYEAGGDDFLEQVILFGMQGPIQVDGMSYNGLMPAWANLDDASIANVLNHIIVELGDGAPAGFTPYTADDVAGHRDDGLSPTDVYDIRSQLGL